VAAVNNRITPRRKVLNKKTIAKRQKLLRMYGAVVPRPYQLLEECVERAIPGGIRDGYKYSEEDGPSDERIRALQESITRRVMLEIDQYFEFMDSPEFTEEE
jgi:hypothetical protein